MKDFSIRDYLLTNKLAEESEWGMQLIPSEKVFDLFKINSNVLDESECKIYLSTLINYFHRYEVLDCFKFYLEQEDNYWNLYYSYENESNFTKEVDDATHNVLDYFHDIMMIVLPKVSGISHLATNLIYNL